MTLPYVFASPQYWDDGDCQIRPDGNLDVTYTRPNASGGSYVVWIGQAEADTEPAFNWDLLFGGQDAFGPVTFIIPNRAPISSTNALVYLRVLVQSVLLPEWPGGITGLKLAETPIGELPAGWFEVLRYGALTYGALNPALPIVSYTARPASAIRLDKRIGLDGGAP